MICAINLDILSTWEKTTGQTAATEPETISEPMGHVAPAVITDGLSPP
ncbi:hypothetical protein [Streptomyces hainanensis]|nr:hypothetical protein [Streptomyces hainanensis]